MNPMHLRRISFICLLPLFLVLFAVFSAPASGQEARKEQLVIGLLPEMNVFKQKQRYEALAAYLSDRMDLEVRLTILSLYGNIIERIRDRKVDGAFLGSFTGALAISQLGILPLARPINMDGTSTYYGYIFVNRNSDIKTAADMKNKTLALVEKATTAGYVFPLAWFREQGIDDIDAYFSSHFFTGSHDGAIDAVLNNRADVGAAKNTIYERMREADPRIDKELLILASSPRVPSNSLCVNASLAPQQRDRLKSLLLNLHLEPEGIEVLRQLGVKRFVETAEEDYLPVIDLAEDAGISLRNYDYHNP